MPDVKRRNGNPIRVRFFLGAILESVCIHSPAAAQKPGLILKRSEKELTIISKCIIVLST